MSSKTGRVRYVRLSPGRRHFQQSLIKLIGKKPCQLSATSDALLRGMRAVLELREGVDLLPFGKLVSKVCEFAEVPGKLPIAYPGQVVAAIADSCRRLPPDRPLGRVARIAGIHRAIAATLQTLRGFEIDAHAIELAAGSASEYLAPKLLDLAFVLRETEEALKLLRLGHMSDWITATIATDPAKADGVGRVILAADADTTPLIAEWVSWVAKTGSEVVVVGEVHSAIESLFARPGQILPGVTAEEWIDESSVGNLVFAPDPEPREGPDVEIVSTADLLAECEWALRACDLEKTKGRDFGDMAILARDLQQYGPFLSSAAERLGVPIVMGRRAPLLSNRLAAFFADLLTALGAADVRKLLGPLRSPYVGLDRELYGMIETTLRESRRIRGPDWEVLELAAETEVLREAVPWLPPLLAWRKSSREHAVEPFEWIGRFFDFAEIMPWQETLIEDPVIVERDGRAVSALKGVLQEQASIAKVRGRGALSYDDAITWMRRAWEDADYSIPPAPTGVLVAGSASELQAVDVLFVLGMLEGTFPRRPREDPILCDAERDELSDLCGLPIKLPTSRLDAIGEREEFVRVCAAPRRRLVLSYPATSDNRDNIPTAYLEEATRFSKNVAKSLRRRTEYVPAKPSLKTDVVFAEALAKPTQPLAETDFALPEVRAKFVVPEGTAVSATDLRRASTCAFEFAAHDLLRVFPDRTPGAWGRLVNLPRAARLATQPTPEAARASLRLALDELLDGLIGRLDEWELNLLAASGARHIEEWITREFRAREIWPREVVAVDVGLGEHGTRAAAGKGVPLIGRLPALSRMGPYSVAHLYETTATERLEPDKNPGNMLYYGTLLALVRCGCEGAALEVDGMNGKRVLLLQPNRNAGQRTDRDSGLFVTSFEGGESQADVARRVRDLVNEAVATMRSGDVRPQPSDRCERCQYGELCRRSRSFGETADPFEVSNG